MNGYVLDGCTLINLYCAWGSIDNLASLSAPFHIGATVASEIIYVRDYDDEGNVVTRDLTATEMSRHQLLRELQPTSAEVDLMVRLSEWLDDGEAEGLAIAASREMTFCTDDGPVQKAADALGIRANITSTPALLLSWAENDPPNLETLPGLVKRITELGRFRPHRSSQYFSWWMKNLEGP